VSIDAARALKVVAVTGASGFIGSHAVDTFERAGLRVRAFSRQSSVARVRSLNYLDSESVARAIEGIQTLVHIAGLAHVSSRRMPDADGRFHEANVLVAVSVAKACLMAGVANLVMLSTAGVLGGQSPPGGFEDSSRPDPYDAYTKSKLEGELRVSELASAGNLAVAIIRPPMVYGPNAPGTFSRLCAWIDRGWPVPVGSLDTRRSFLGIRNLCDALLHAANARVQGINAMLVADTEPVTMAEFARQIAHHMGRPSRIVSVPLWLLKCGLVATGRADDIRRLAYPFELHPSRLQTLLGWRVPYPLDAELGWALRSAIAAAPRRDN
jgi:nucleoside-diphosphate-sugar epimerase